MVEQATPARIPDVVREVLAEVDRAIAKFPTWPADLVHACQVFNEESGELTRAVLQQMYEPEKNPPGAVRKEALQAAAMALRFLAALDLYDWTPGRQIEQRNISTVTSNLQSAVAAHLTRAPVQPVAAKVPSEFDGERYCDMVDAYDAALKEGWNREQAMGCAIRAYHFQPHPQAAQGGEAEDNLGRAIQALIRGDIKCSDDLPVDRRPQSVGARRGFGAVHEYMLTHPAERAAVPEPWKHVLEGFVRSLNRRRDGQLLTIDHDGLSELAKEAEGLLSAAPTLAGKGVAK